MINFVLHRKSILEDEILTTVISELTITGYGTKFVMFALLTLTLYSMMTKKEKIFVQ